MENSPHEIHTHMPFTCALICLHAAFRGRGCIQQTSNALNYMHCSNNEHISRRRGQRRYLNQPRPLKLLISDCPLYSNDRTQSYCNIYYKKLANITSMLTYNMSCIITQSFNAYSKIGADIAPLYRAYIMLLKQ